MAAPNTDDEPPAAGVVFEPNTDGAELLPKPNTGGGFEAAADSVVAPEPPPFIAVPNTGVDALLPVSAPNAGAVAEREKPLVSADEFAKPPPSVAVVVVAAAPNVNPSVEVVLGAAAKSNGFELIELVFVAPKVKLGFVAAAAADILFVPSVDG